MAPVNIDPSLFNRRHPAFSAMQPHWQFVEETYKGGRAWFGSNIFKYFREGDVEFKDRQQRAYRFNHTREIVDLITKYVLKGGPERNEADAPTELQDFWKKATKGGRDITALVREVSNGTSIFGQPYIVVDSTLRAEGPLTVADAKNQRARVYAYMVKPQHALDMSFDEHGELNWILFYETKREDSSFYSDHLEFGCYRLWTRSETVLYRVREATSEEMARRFVRPIGGATTTFRSSAMGAGRPEAKMVVEEIDRVQHDLGEVPVIIARDRDSDTEYSAPGMVDDIAYLDRATANYLSNLDAIIQDQTFSTLTIPSQALEDAESSYQKIVELGTKRVFAYDAEGGKGPEYISPDPKQAEIILAVITKIITEIYHSVGMAGERTKMDNAAGIDNSSGVAKAYDFDRMNTMLKAKADRLQDVENELARLVLLWHGKKLDRDLVVYPTDFDTRNLYDEFDVASRLALLSAPDDLRRHQMEKLVEKLFPALSDDLKTKIKSELAKWPPEEDILAPTRAPSLLQDRGKPKSENKQGQNNKE